MESGGAILWLIVMTSTVMWLLIVERYLYYYQMYPKLTEEALHTWRQRREHTSWIAQQIRQGLIGEIQQRLSHSLLMIKTLTILLPLLGLLGTVEGMIQTFDVLSVFGSGNTRGLAGGISVALFTTMAGLLTALSGLYFSSELTERNQRLTQALADKLTYE
ncbi:MAG TPA: biopolymer transporter ExbB [Gammaproteobacteria bacterium]|nr:biopolymer transporter ExbB [Gammaproteobacteria bacterium]